MTHPTSNQRCEHLQLTKCDNDGDGTFYWICVEPGCDFSTPMQNADDGSWYELTRSADETSVKVREVGDTSECDMRIVIASDTDEKVSNCFRAIDETLTALTEHHDVELTISCITGSAATPETPPLQLRAVPSAWMRGIKSYVPGEPDEWDTEFSYGDDQPEGEGWVPLYSKPPHLRPSPEETSATCFDCETARRSGQPACSQHQKATEHSPSSRCEDRSCHICYPESIV